MSSIFKTNPMSNGYSWTITSKLGHILRTAEENFGERDKSYTILGIEFTTIGNPQIWYPYPISCKNVIIQITEDCINDLNRAVFQVAHEVIHCLSPSGGQNANILEEGLANLFSIIYCRNNGHGNDWSSGTQSYTNASNLVEQLLSIDPDIIKKLRTIEPTFSKIDTDLMIKVNSNIPYELTYKLTQKFIR